MIKKKQTFSKIIIISFIIALTIFRSIYAFAITLSEDKGELNIFIEGLLPANPVKIKMKLYRIKEITDSKEENLLKDEIQEESTEKIKEVEEANSNELNFKFTKEFKDIANIDETGYGLLHISTGRLKSRKLFSWGNNDASDHWQEFLTDKAGRYIEIQAGLAKTQYGCIPMAPHTAWEWMERYGAAQISTELLNQNHWERARHFTKELDIGSAWDAMEQKLADTKSMARGRAKLVFEGSGYGALKKQGRMTEHLEFAVKEESLEKWTEFFDTSILHCPDPSQRPDEFLIDETNITFLKESMKDKNAGNWYAYYHMGLGYFTEGKYKKAKKAYNKGISAFYVTNL